MKNKIIKDGIWLLLGTMLNMIIMLMMQVILARNLDLDEYGAVISAFNFVNFLALFISLGASEYILKSFGKHGSAAYKIVQTWLKFLPISIGVLLLVVVTTYTSSIFGELTNVFLLLIIPNIILQGLLPLTLTIYQIESKYKMIVILNLVLYSSRLIAAAASLVYKNNIYIIGVTLTIVSIIGLGYFYIHLKRYFLQDLEFPHDETVVLDDKFILKDTIKGVLPYAFLAFFYYGFYQSNIIFINIFLSEEAVGLYNAAFTIISLTFILPTIVLSQLFNPKLHFWVVNDVKKVISLFVNGSKWMFLLGVAIAAILYVLNEYVINIIFGVKFEEAVIILNWLLIIVPLRYLQAVSDAIMNIENQIHIKTRVFFVVFIISLILNITLIPRMGIDGVILATIISEVLLFALTFMFGWKFIKVKMSNVQTK